MRRWYTHLESPEELEGDDGQQEADDGDATANVGDDLQRDAVRVRERRRVDVHQNGEVGQVIALAGGVRGVGCQPTAALLGPVVERVVPVDAARVGDVLCVEVAEHKQRWVRQLHVSALAE